MISPQDAAPNDRIDDLTKSSYVVADCETTGIDPETDRIVEFSLVRFKYGRIMERLSALVDPGIDIPAVASAVHNLTARDVRGKPPIDDYASDIVDFCGNDAIVAHNAPFDAKFFGEMLPAHRWICTLRLARRIWPNAPKHTNAVLRYHLGLDEAHDLSQVQAHRAESDCVVTGYLFKRQLDELQIAGESSTIDDVRDLCWAPIPVERLFAGRKYWGRKISEIPPDYLNWVYGEQVKPANERAISLDADTLDAVATRLAVQHFGAAGGQR